ncbi:hypothetical protein D918_03769 [Trichuris suis]|nr:hypothetical protein D918_03769 [Trichuris suis]
MLQETLNASRSCSSKSLFKCTICCRQFAFNCCLLGRLFARRRLGQRNFQKVPLILTLRD